MKKTGGIKVYRSNKRKQYAKPKSKGQKIFSWVLVFVIMGALIFVGYSICDPVVEFVEKWKNRDENISLELESITNSIVSTETTLSQSEISESTTVTTSTVIDSSLSGFKCLNLSSGDVKSMSALNSAAERAVSGGYNAVVLTLKEEGGAINYSSSAEMALLPENAIQSYLNLSSAVSMLKSKGLFPIAKINLLYDNNKYDYLDGTRIGSYKFQDQSNWLDNKPSSGGKPWLSPFDSDTQNYFAQLSQEISFAGFEMIICDGVIFPTFHNSDLNYIGDIVKSSDRYKALINAVDIVKKNGENNNSTTILEVSAKDIINSTAEVYKPNELTIECVSVIYRSSDFTGKIVIENIEYDLATLSETEKAVKVFEAVKSKSGDLRIIPNLEGIDSNSDVAEILNSMGYETYIFS